MADFNSVPLGQAGTGSAFVLGENRALNRYLENQDYNAQVDRQNALLRQKQQADIARQRQTDWTKGALKAEGGLIFPDIDKRANDYMSKAKEMYLKGENPYAPDSPLSEERRIIEMSVDKRKALQPIYLQEIKNIDPSKHTPESIDELMQYQNLPIEEALAKGIPQLKPKFDPIKLINDIKIGTETVQYDKNGRTIKSVSTDPNTVNQTVVSRLKNEPSINSYLTNDLGIPKEFTVDVLEKMPNTVEGVKESVMGEYTGNKAFREQLASAYGITSKDDPKLTALMLQKATENLQYKKSYDAFKKSISDAIIAKNPSQQSNTVDYSALNYQRNLSKDAEEDSSAVIESTDQTIPIQNKNVPARNIIRISPTAFNLGGLSGYDTLSDANIKIPNVEGGVKLANIAWYPFSKSGIETTKNKLTGKESKRSVGGKLVQEDYASKNPNDIEYRPMALVSYTEGEGVLKKQKDILIPVDDLPKDKKDIQKRIATLKANAPKQPSQPQQAKQSQGKKQIKGF